MENKKLTIREIIIIILLVIMLGLIFYSLISDYKNNRLNKGEDDTNITPIFNNKEYCYYRSNETSSGYYDVSWLRVKEEGDYVSGEFRNLPAEKDSKVGNFSGTIISHVKEAGVKKAVVIWNSFAEGMESKEEFIFDYSEQHAIPYFGEMEDNGNGIYRLKNRENLYPQAIMDPIDCSLLEEKLSLEKYIETNISNLSKTKEVLGGRWYVLSTVINPLSNTGEVVYEDGHIEEKASFIYSYDNSTKEIVINNFEQIK